MLAMFFFFSCDPAGRWEKLVSDEKPLPADSLVPVYLKRIDSLVIAAYADPYSVMEEITDLHNDLLNNNIYDIPELKNEVTFLKAIAFYVGGEYDSSLYYARAAADGYTTMGDSLAMFNAWATMGAVHMYQGNYDSAQYYLLPGYRYFRTLGKPEYILKAGINLSGTYFYAGKPDISLQYLRENLKVLDRYHNPRFLSRTLLNTGIVLEHQGRHDDARDTLLLALEESLSLREIPVITDCLNRLGLLEFNLGNYEESLAWFQRLFKESEVWSDRFIMSEALTHLSLLYDSLGQPERALESSLKAYSIAVEIGSRSQEALAARRLAEIYNKMGITRYTNKYLWRFVHLNDSLLNGEKNRQILEMENLYKARQREEEVQQLTLINQLNEVKISQFQNFLFSLGMLLLVLGITAYFQMRQVRIRQKQHSLEFEQRLFRLQLNPHFIFNTLASIQTYILENEKDQAANLLADFGRLMRMILENSEREWISLDNEMEMIGIYLRLQQTRFPGLFEYEIIRDEENESGLMVPPMLLQPFVENAIEHGIRPAGHPGLIRIVSRLSGPALKLEVIDNGIGRTRSPGNKHRNHISLATEIARKRFLNLKERHKKSFHFEVADQYDHSGNPSGTQVSFLLPEIYDQ